MERTGADVLRRDHGTAFIAAVLGRLADDLHEAAAAIGSEFFVRDALSHY